MNRHDPLAAALGNRGFGPGGAGAPPAPPKPQPRALRDGEIELGRAPNGDVAPLHLGKLIEGRLLIQGNSGAGKSMLLRRIFEQAFGKVQQLLVDPDGEFSTLAEKHDVAILTAADALRVGGGALALHLRQHRYSAVLDLSDATSEQRLCIVADLATGLIESPPELWQPLLVHVDEAQTIAPHYDTGDVDADTRKRAISALADMMGRGRKRGVAGVIATQRLAETSKAVVAKATNIIVGQTVFDIDQERAGALIGFTAGASRALRTLTAGEFLCLGPALAGPTRVRFMAGTADSRHKGEAPIIVAPPSISAANAAELLRAIPDMNPADTGSTRPSTGGARPGWTEAEDKIVMQGYDDKLRMPEIVAKLVEAGFKHRTLGSVSGRGQLLGCTSKGRSHLWTPEEDAIVRAGYDDTNVRLADIVANLAKAGFERQRGAVQMRAISLGISGDRVNYWTEAEKAIATAGLTEGKRHSDILEDLRVAGYHRGVTALSKFAALNGFARPTENAWTDEHLQILKDCYADGRGPKEAQRLTGRPYQSIVSKASALRISVNREYTVEQRELIEKMHEKGAKLTQVAKALGKPYANVARVTAKMGLDFSQNRGEPATTVKPAKAKKRSKS
jgi:hypothetical protein